jgi:hypothetical protein
VDGTGFETCPVVGFRVNGIIRVLLPEYQFLGIKSTE